MLKNYLKTAFRNLSRHKGYSLIYISGFAIAVITVSFQSIKASIANPVDSLKYE